MQLHNQDWKIVKERRVGRSGLPVENNDLQFMKKTKKELSSRPPLYNLPNITEHPELWYLICVFPMVAMVQSAGYS